MADQFYIGKRLSYDGQLCTVRYHGEVQGTKGEWLGVEWDDATRGKHSGENGGVKYFECVSSQPTAGSFVRPTRKYDLPRSFVEALKAKYASEDFEDPDVRIVCVRDGKKKDSLARQNQPIRFSGKEAEEVGFDKIRKKLANLHELRIVILDGLCMSRPVARRRERVDATEDDAWPADLADIKEACPKVIELDLSRNLFEEWREVASICEQLPRLGSLRVDGNRFRDTTITAADKHRYLSAFANIRGLRLENTLLPWEDMTTITSLFPNLTTFVASSNAYRFLSDHIPAPTITDITLEDNALTTISGLNALARLANLRRLVLKSNIIFSIDAKNAPCAVFARSLSELDLSYNAIADWSFINALPAHFPGLTSLRISHNPLYASLQAADGRVLSAEDGYMLTLARLALLKTLNYSPITAKERLNAETYYLSLIARELTYGSEGVVNKIIQSHPRYRELCEEYGEPVIQRSANAVNPNSLAASLIRLNLYLGESARVVLSASGESIPEKWEVEIPKSFTAYSLLGSVAKKTGLPPLKLRLVWETGDCIHDHSSTGAGDDESWDSEDSDEEPEGKMLVERIMREVEILPGTRLVGTWVEGVKANIRVEVR